MYGNMNMGSFYSDISKPFRPDLAEPYFKVLMSFSESQPRYFEMVALPAYLSVGDFYYEKKDFLQSIDFFMKALEAEKRERNPRTRLHIYDRIRNSGDSLKNLPLQNKYLKLYVKLKDSMDANEKKYVIDESRKKINQSAKNAESSIKNVFLISICCILIIGAGIWVFFKDRNKKLKKNYERIIERMNLREPDDVPALPTDNVEADSLEDNIDTEDCSAKNSISEETTKTLLAKIQKFESSHTFLKKKITLTWLAHSFNTNPKYLSNIIKQYKGKSFTNYVNGLRIDYITRKLYEDPQFSLYKLSYLSEICGFSSREVFTTVFKRETGVTPSYFIERLKSSV